MAGGLTSLLVVPLVIGLLAFWFNPESTTVASFDHNSPSWSQPLASQPAVSDFAVKVIEEQKPIVTTNSLVGLFLFDFPSSTQVTDWPALQLTHQQIIDILPTLRVHESDSPWIRMHTIAQPYGQVSGVTWRRPWKVLFHFYRFSPCSGSNYQVF